MREAEGMSSRARRSAAWVGYVCCAALVSACGGSDEAPTSGAGTGAATTPTPIASSAPARDLDASSAITTDVAPTTPVVLPGESDGFVSRLKRAMNPAIEPAVAAPAAAGDGVAAPDVLPPDPWRQGAWNAPQRWPLISIHAALLPDGRVMTYGTNQDGQQTGRFIYDLWDSRAARLDSGHMTLPNVTPTDLFCNAQTVLATTGELFMAGGDLYVDGKTLNQGNDNSVLFRPGDNSLRSGSTMHRARWYSSVTSLSDGQILVMGGSGAAGGTGPADRPEVRTQDGAFRLLSDVRNNDENLNYWYPRHFLTADDRVFGLDVDGRMYIVDPRDEGYLQRLTNLIEPFVGRGSSAVMYAPGQVLQVGGNSARVARLSIDRAEPLYIETASTSSARFWGTTTALPDGRVLVTGGSAVDNEVGSANNSAELWDPVTGTWTVAASGSLARLYHSVALLLPDASVLVAGGGAPGPLTNTNAERYWPPYLFNAQGALAERPKIVTAPDALAPGQRFTLTYAGTAAFDKLVMMRIGSVTHSFNFDQRRLVLPHRREGAVVTAQLPTSGTAVPPGYYMLFALDVSGVPSMAHMVSVKAGAASAIGADWTGTLGGSGGDKFRTECAADEVLVGVHGTSTNVLASVGPQCVRVDAKGQWVGDPRNEAVTGGGNGTPFTRTCARHSAVTGITGQSGNLTDNIQLACSALATASRRQEGSPTLLAVAGGAGGAPRAQRNCGLQGVATSLYGRAASLVDSVGLLCRSEDVADAFPFFTRAPTPHAGGRGGDDFALSCHSDEVLVGVQGRESDLIHRLTPLCVKVDDRGTWTADVIGRGATGGDAGQPFTRVCPANQAVSGFTVQTDQFVNGLSLQCRPLASAGRFSVATASALAQAGGRTGSVQARACANDQPAHGLVGRSGTLIDGMALSCRGELASATRRRQPL